LRIDGRQGAAQDLMLWVDVTPYVIDRKDFDMPVLLGVFEATVPATRMSRKRVTALSSSRACHDLLANRVAH
jgi:hypothetical protein